MCDALNYVVGVVIGQKRDKKPINIGCAKAEMNYMTTKKELVVVVYGLEKFYPKSWKVRSLFLLIM